MEVGPSEHGREMISIDISEYGDPLYSRAVRVPFSVYLKPWQQPWGFDVDVLANLQPLFVIPLQGIDWREGIGAMRDPQLTAELAAHANTTIPDATRGTGKVLDDYREIEASKISRMVLLARTASSRTLAGNLRSAAFGNSAGLRPRRARNAK